MQFEIFVAVVTIVVFLILRKRKNSSGDKSNLVLWSLVLTPILMYLVKYFSTTYREGESQGPLVQNVPQVLSDTSSFDLSIPFPVQLSSID
jgi:hypothetical protein